jgi:hypothetical protein
MSLPTRLKVGTDIVDLDDVGVVQLRHGFRFAKEPANDLVGAADVGGEDLQCNGLLGDLVSRFEDYAHGTPTDLIHDVVMAQIRPDQRFDRGEHGLTVGVEFPAIVAGTGLQAVEIFRLHKGVLAFLN